MKTKLLSPTTAFEIAFIPQTCRFCDTEAERCTTPPLCARHLDIVIIVSYLQRNDLDVSLDNALVLLNGCQADGGWIITKAELKTMFPEFIASNHQ